jgi:hypothetical protein
MHNLAHLLAVLEPAFVSGYFHMSSVHHIASGGHIQYGEEADGHKEVPEEADTLPAVGLPKEVPHKVDAQCH